MMEDLLRYQGKACVVTGASSGIGKALCEILISLGAEVYALSRSDTKLQGLRGSFVVDLSNKAQIDEAFEGLPEHIDCFFGVAGLSGLHNDFFTTFNVDFTANKYMTETYLVDRMTAGGAIAYVTSTAGSEWEQYRDALEGIVDASGWEDTVEQIQDLGDDNTPGQMAYFFSKMAMNYYTMKNACRLGERGIRVNALLPGSTDTGMKDDFELLAGGESQLLAQTGLAKRLASCEEMAWPAAFINSPLSSFVSGVELYVDYADKALVRIGLKESLYS